MVLDAEIALRDRLIFGDNPPEYFDTGGIGRFNLNLSELEELTVRGLINPQNKMNDAPLIQVLQSMAAKFISHPSDKAVLSGYVYAAWFYPQEMEAPDGAFVDMVEIFKHDRFTDKDMTLATSQICALKPDTFCLKQTYFQMWWD